MQDLTDMIQMMFIFCAIVWLASCFLVSFVAGQKNRDAIGWGFGALFLSPVVTLLALGALEPLPGYEEKPLPAPGHYAPNPNKSPDISQKFSG